jgi:predicted nucleotide-binding protein
MTNPREVFVIHGRDEAVRKAFWGFLQDLDLHPLDWEEIVAKTGSGTPFLGDVLPKAFQDNQAAVVLLTPDDGAYLHPSLREPQDPDHESELTGQARPNVLFEAGMAFAVQPGRTVLIEIGGLRPFSDIGGRNVIKFKPSAESLQKIANRLTIAGCAVNTAGTDWLDLQRFAGLEALTRRFP